MSYGNWNKPVVLSVSFRWEFDDGRVSHCVQVGACIGIERMTGCVWMKQVLKRKGRRDLKA
jgi:hypothetical protein